MSRILSGQALTHTECGNPVTRNLAGIHSSPTAKLEHCVIHRATERLILLRATSQNATRNRKPERGTSQTRNADRHGKPCPTRVIAKANCPHSGLYFPNRLCDNCPHGH